MREIVAHRTERAYAGGCRANDYQCFADPSNATLYSAEPRAKIGVIH